MHRAIPLLAAVLFAAPAFAQDSDEYLHQRRAELIMRDVTPQAKLRGYRGRVTSPDYYTELQMQQLDKQQRADDQAEAEALLQELNRRESARFDAWMQAEQQAARAQRDRENAATFARSQDQMRQNIEATRQRTEAMRQSNDALAEQNRRSSQAGAAAAEALLARSSAETARQAEEAWRWMEQQPAPSGPSGPPLRPYFPPVQPMARQRTPLEAFQEGQQAGDAIGKMLVGFRDRHKRKRKDAIVQRYFEGTITREDYAQLAQDGYTDLALQLARDEQRD